MDERVRKWVERLDAQRRRPLAEQLEDDLGPLRGISMEERARIVAEVCRAAWRIIENRPDRERILAHQDPLPPESRERWDELVRRTAERRRRGRH